MKHLIGGSTLLVTLLASVAISSAQSEQPGVDRGFVEVAGDYGLQFGEQKYLPDGTPDQRKHPYTNGFGFNVTAGHPMVAGLDVIVDHAFASARSRSGQLIGVLDGVAGSIEYQTIVAGLRSSRALGPGRLCGELAVGVVLPFETTLEYEYAPEMNAAGISGTGTKTDRSMCTSVRPGSSRALASRSPGVTRSRSAGRA